MYSNDVYLYIHLLDGLFTYNMRAMTTKPKLYAIDLSNCQRSISRVIIQTLTIPNEIQMWEIFSINKHDSIRARLTMDKFNPFITIYAQIIAKIRCKLFIEINFTTLFHKLTLAQTPHKHTRARALARVCLKIIERNSRRKLVIMHRPNYSMIFPYFRRAIR